MCSSSITTAWYPLSSTILVAKGSIAHCLWVVPANPMRRKVEGAEAVLARPCFARTFPDPRTAHVEKRNSNGTEPGRAF